MARCSLCGKLTRFRDATARRVVALCLACLAGGHALGVGILGTGFEGPDDVLGYGDQVSIATNSDIRYLYADDGPSQVIVADWEPVNSGPLFHLRSPPETSLD